MAEPTKDTKPKADKPAEKPVKSGCGCGCGTTKK